MGEVKKRLWIMKFFCLLIFLALIMKLAALQLFDGSHYLILSEQNCTSTERIWAPRGRIFDRNGQVLVSNRLVFGIDLEPYELRKADAVTLLSNVARISNSTEEEVIFAIYPEFKLPPVPVTGGEEDVLDGSFSERVIPALKSWFKEQDIKFSTFSLKVDLLLYALSHLLEVDYVELSKMIEKDKLGFEAVRIYNHLSAKELVQVEAALPYLPAINVEKAPMREYLYGSLASHLLGYMGFIDRDDWQRYNEQGYSITEKVGKAGLEYQYEFELHPVAGKKVVLVNSRGVQISDESVKILKEPKQGADLVLNIDYSLQKKAEELLASTIQWLRKEYKKDPEKVKGFPQGGAVVVLKPENGEVLVMASYPAYDPNVFIDIKRRNERNKLFSDSARPLINRAIYTPGSKGVQPGSIFKIVTAAAALDYLDITRETVINDRWGAKVYYDKDRPRKNWKYPVGDGKINLIDALSRSNNIFFYDMGFRFNLTGLEDEPLVEWALNFGLNSTTGIDLPGEGGGFIPIRKEGSIYYKNTEGYWVPGETLNMVIGQGRLLATPLQMANLIAAIANGGEIYKPFLVREVLYPDGTREEKEPEILKKVALEPEHLQIIREGMRGAVADPYGTAFSAFRDFPISVAGKTGTAQNLPGHPAHGWFGAYAPFDDPEVVVLVFLEEGGSSSYTLPIAREILSAYFGIENENEEKNEENAD